MYLYFMSKKSYPIFIESSIYTNGQDFFDTQYKFKTEIEVCICTVCPRSPVQFSYNPPYIQMDKNFMTLSINSFRTQHLISPVALISVHHLPAKKNLNSSLAKNYIKYFSQSEIFAPTKRYMSKIKQDFCSILFIFVKVKDAICIY